MTLKEIQDSDLVFLNAEDIAPIIGSKAHDLRVVARKHPDWLGFPAVITSEHRVKFPRVPFLEFLGQKE